MNEHAIIKIILIGTKGQLDLPECKYSVKYLEDQAEEVKNIILEIIKEHPEYKNFGWSIVNATKFLSDKEIEDLSKNS